MSGEHERCPFCGDDMCEGHPCDETEYPVVSDLAKLRIVRQILMDIDATPSVSRAHASALRDIDLMIVMLNGELSARQKQWKAGDK